MARQPDVKEVLDQGVQIPRTSSINWDIPVNANWELLNDALKRKYDRDGDEEQVIQGERTLVLSLFKFLETIDGNITNSELAKLAESVKEKLFINEDAYDGSVEKSFDLVEKADVTNAAGHIPRYTDEGHLQLPNGVEIW